MKPISERLRAMHAAMRPHLTTPGTQEQAYSVIATAERWRDLLEAAEMLDRLNQEQIKEGEQQ